MNLEGELIPQRQPTKQYKSGRAVQYNGVTNANEEESEVTFTVTLNGASSGKRTFADSESTDMEMTGEENLTHTNGVKKFKKQRCQFWPSCKRGDDCMFHHPTFPCALFPRCPYGAECLFIHPAVHCTFGTQCSRPDCQFNHPPRPSPGNTPCRKGFACPRGNCPFLHPPDACRYGDKCTRPNCTFGHGKVCRYSANCSLAGCTFVHRRTIDSPCKFGASCTNPSCRFLHDEEEAVANSEAGESVNFISSTLPATPPQVS